MKYMDKSNNMSARGGSASGGKKLIILTTLAVSLILTGCAKQAGKDASDETSNTQLANPASVYCEEQGGKLEIIETAEGQSGICKFDDRSECDEWAFFRGECSPTSGLVQSDDVQPDEKENITAKGNDKIKVFNIEDGQTIFSPVTIQGKAVAFENNLIVELRNSDHETLVKEFATIKSSEVGGIGNYSITLNFAFSNTKEGFIAVYEQSTEDGSELNLVEIPVKFGNSDKSTN